MLSRWLTKRLAMKTQGEAEAQLHAFLTSTLNVSGKLHAPVVLSSEERPLVPIG
jgi:hypothetical protein